MKDIKSYLNKITKGNDSISYICFLGSFHKFLYRPSKESNFFLRERLKSYGNFRKKLLSISLPFLKYLPFVSRIDLPYSKKEDFPGELIIKAYRIKVFDFKNSKVYTIPYNKEGKEDLVREIKIKRIIKGLGINTSEVVLSKKDYTVERYIPVKSFGKLDESSFVYLEKAFRQLIKFYNFNGVKKVKLSSELNSLRKSLKSINSKVINSCFKFLDNYSKNSVYVTTIHGDFHLGNLGYYNDKVYIFDWGSFRRGYILEDLFWLLFVDYDHTGNLEYFDNVPFVKLYKYKFSKIDLKIYLLLSLLRRIERDLKLKHSKEANNNIKLLAKLIK